MTKGIDIVNWFTILPGPLSLVGWLLHVTVYRRTWFVTADPMRYPPSEGAVRVEGLSRDDADALFIKLIGWLQAGHRLAEFTTPNP